MSFRILVLILLILPLIPAYAQEQSDETIVLTDKGTLKVGLSTIPSKPDTNSETKIKINFINKVTNAVQEHIDYSVVVKKGETQVFGIPLTHTATGSITIPYQFKENGDYQITVNVEVILFQPIPMESATFSVSVGEEKPKPNGCLIATAAFGSELAPQVQFLREYRDKTIISAASGSAFINAFNAVYYSFSPAVADAERSNPLLQEVIRTGITPLLGILQIAKSSGGGEGETSVITSGIVASSLIGAAYLWPIGLVSKQIRHGSRPNYKILVFVTSISILLTIASVAIGNAQFMMFTTSFLVLSLAGVGAIFSAWAIVKTMKKIKITFL